MKRNLNQAIARAESLSKNNPTVDYFVVFEDDESGYHVCREEDLDGYFCGIEPLAYAKNGVIEY